MIRKKVQIINALGLHARAAAKFVQIAGRYHSDIVVSRDGKTVNGKSIMGVMMLAANKQSWIELMINGQDEEMALENLESLISNRFGETS
ncbi:MAG: HPr family phosphocarrier protein [Gammaproteobacteria bacterium]